MRIDHVVMTTRDLDDAARRLVAEHGLGSVVGGSHPAWGTANRIVPAGESYLEVMGVDDPATAAGNELGRLVLDTSAHGDGLALVCLRPEDLASTCERLGLDARERSRETPDGTTLGWRMAGLERATAERLPFFIAWDGATGAQVPAPEEGRAAEAVVAVELGGDPQAVAAYVGEEVPGLHLVGGAPGVHAVVLRTAEGEVRLENPL